MNVEKTSESAPRMLTTSQVAKMLGYTPEGVRGLCDRGVFPYAFRAVPGGPWRIPEPDVEALRGQARAVQRRRRRGL